MPQALVREAWSKGWTPGSDENGGDPTGLLRMDNCKLDSFGSLTLEKGFINVGGPYSGPVHSIFSHTFDGGKYRFVGAGADVWVNSEVMVSGAGSSGRANFSAALGDVFVSSGTQKKKFEYGGGVFNWGVETPLRPVAIDVFSDVLPLELNFSVVEGTPLGTNQGYPDSTTLRVVWFSGAGGDYTAMPLGGIATDEDIFSFQYLCGETNVLEKVRVEVQLGTSDQSGVRNYYWAEWQHNIDQVTFVEGDHTLSTLQIKRGDFTREGDDTSLNWTNVAGVRVTCILNGLSSTTDGSLRDDQTISDFQWTGGSEQPINGTDIQYIQINARNNGHYVAKSAVGPASPPKSVINARIILRPDDSSDPQINRIYLYRRGGSIPRGPQFSDTGLAYYYQIFEINLENSTATGADGRVQSYGGSVTDNVSNTDAHNLGIIANLNTKSVHDIDDEFVSIIDGIYSDRMIIASSSQIYISESGNPDAIDIPHSIKLSGDFTERILWLSKVAAQVFLAGTEKNIYEISGPLTQLPDGSIDVNIRPLGEAHPPISYDRCLDSGLVFYRANDGWRSTNGGASQLISFSLNTLFRGNNRYGVAAAATYASGAAYPCAIYKGQLYTSNILVDGSRPLFIYDLSLQYWRLHYTNPISLYVEEDGTLLGGYGDDFHLKQLDIGTQIEGNDPAHGQKIFIQTVFDDNGLPRNRKDAYTLRVLMDTGGGTVNVYLSGDNGGYEIVGTATRNGEYEYFFDLFAPFTQKFGLGFKYSLLLIGDNLSTFKLTKFTIEYDPRPELVTALRIPQSNLGSYSRKRITNFAFVIDTLDHIADFQLYVDNQAFGDKVPVQINGKNTFIYYLTEECVGTDFGGILQIRPENPEGAFEFYGLNLEEITSEKLPTPVKWLRIPGDNYGTPNRKRHSSYKFEINTRGAAVRFTPQIDGIEYASKIYNTSRKQTVEYFFTVDTIGIDIGGILESVDDTPFEFYGVIRPQDIETLPPRLCEFRIPDTNYDTPNRKRHTSYKFQINTNGMPVRFLPILDGVYGPPTTFTTAQRQTVEYFFTQPDTVSIDIGGELFSQTEIPFEFYKVVTPQHIEVLPDRLEAYLIPPNDYGVPNRKRHSSYKFVINTNGYPVKFTPIIDLVEKTPSIVNTPSKQTYEHFFYEDTIGKDIGGKLESVVGYPFEFYWTVVPQQIEELPPRLTYFLVPPNDYGKPNRKRHSSYKFQINTNGKDVQCTPIIDLVRKTPQIFNTPSKQTVEYFFREDTIGKDIGCELLSLEETPFEFYGVVVPQTVETLPDRLEFFLIPPNDYGKPNRKRHSSYKFQINTNGKNVRFTPILDMVEKEPLIFSTPSKQQVEYFFTFVDTISREIGGKLESVADENGDFTPFEFYGEIVPQDVEVLPDRLEYFRIPCTNYGQPGRKRHSSYKFQINTNGARVRFTPELDLVDRTPAIFNTPSRELVEYFFHEDTTGIDIGGRLEALDGIPFEFYGVVTPEKIEMLPPRLEEFWIPEDNFGAATYKRVRTIPMQINTNGQPVLFTPIVDHARMPTTTFNTPSRQTVWHFFNYDTFGVDYSGELQSLTDTPFEFYGFQRPEEVEIIPVPKLFDQIGPEHIQRIGKIIGFRIRVIARGYSIPYTIYGEDDIIDTGIIATEPLKDEVYEVEWKRKGLNTTVTRIEFGPTSEPFHRYYVDLKYNVGGKPGRDTQIELQRCDDTGRKG